MGEWRQHHWAHLDIKPDNFGVTPNGKWYLLDVETVTSVWPGHRTEFDHAPAHTPPYAAPEVHIRSGAGAGGALVQPFFATDSSDLYSVAVVLAEIGEVRVVGVQSQAVRT